VLQLARRRADDLQYIRCGSLLFEGLPELALARLLRLEQPRVLDGDDGLVGEGAEQSDLRLVEWLSPLAKN